MCRAAGAGADPVHPKPTRKPVHRFLPLTYKPKIPRVLTGEITQSIRIDTDLQVGDFIAFHGWEGRSYHSPWSFRTPYMQLIMAMQINIRKDSVYFPETGETYKRPSGFLNTLARLDGIDPPTTEGLIRVLHAMHGKGTLHGKVLRWDPAPIKDPLRNPQIQDAIRRFYKGCAEPIEQVHATIKESAPLQSPVLSIPSKDFVQIGDIQKNSQDIPGVLQ
jgi:hypothetical protein